MSARTLAVVAVPLTCCVIIQALVSGSALGIAVMAPVLAPVLGVEPVASGSYVSLVYLTAAIASSRAPWWLGFVGPFRLAIISLLFAASGTALIAFGQLWLALLAALITGIGYGLTSPASSELLARITNPSSRALVFSIKQAGVPLGGMLVGITIPALLSWPILGLTSWRSAIVVMTVVSVVTAVAMFAIAHRYEDQPVGKSTHGQRIGILDIFRIDSVRSLVVTSFIFAGFQLAISAYLVLHLVEQVGFSLVEAGGIFSLAQVSGILGRFLWGGVADQIGSNRHVLIALAMGMIVFGLAASSLVAGSAWLWVVLVCVGLGLTTNAWTGIYMAELVAHAPISQAGAITGSAMAVTFAGVFVGPALFGFVVSLSGTYSAGYILFAGFCLVALLLLWRGKHEPSHDKW